MNIPFHVIQQDLKTIHFYWSLSKPEEGPHLILELDAKKNQHKLLGSILSGSLQALPGFTWIIYACVFEAIGCFYHHTCGMPLWLCVKHASVWRCTISTAFPSSRSLMTDMLLGSSVNYSPACNVCL